MLTYLEWGICIASIAFCWCKYGWSNKEVIKGCQGMIKKVEAILLNSESVPTADPSTTRWNTTTFMNMPVTRAQFNRKKMVPSQADDASDASVTGRKSDLEFYRTLRKDDFLQETSGGSSSYNNCCIICARNSEYVVGDRDLVINEDSGIHNCLDCDLRNPENPWYIRKFAFFIFYWRKWSIGHTYHTVTLRDMMGDERLHTAIKASALAELKDNPNASMEVLMRKHRQRAERVIINMRAKMSQVTIFALYCRIAAWIIGKVLGLIYPKILIEKTQIEAVRRARNSGYPIIYLPVHRSHVDYVLVSWTLFNQDMRAPLVAAGENLNIPVFSLMMKSVGGFFIKRRLDRKEGKRDILYRAILKLYMEKSFETDNDMEFFIEGGRTRTGKPCHPKGGLLSIAVDTLITKKVEDIIVVPVNFSYEKLLEGNYVREQLGKAKVKESFASAAIGLWTSLQSKFGNARVDYGAPFSMREYIRGCQAAKASSSPSILSLPSASDCSSEDNDSGRESTSRRSSMGSDRSVDISKADQREVVNMLAKHVIHEGVQCFTLMSTSAIAFILLNKYRNGATMEVLEGEMELLRREFLRRKHKVIFDGVNMKQTIEHGLGVLGPSLIQRELVKTGNPNKPTEVVLCPVTEVPNVIDLSYYSTCVLPIYALEAVAATSILTLMREGSAQQTEVEGDVVIRETDLISTCLELCEILHNEYIFNPPCKTLTESIRETLRFMEEENLLKFQQSSSEDSDDEVMSINDTKKRLIYVDGSAKVQARLVYLQKLNQSILDTYTVSAHALKRLVQCEASEKVLQMDMQAEIKCQLQDNQITFGESVALDPIRNFLKLLTSWEVLECEKKEGTIVHFLNDHFDNEKAVEEVITRIERFQQL